MVLHGDEAVPAVLLGRGQRLRELPGGHAAGAQVAHLAVAHQGVERVQGFFDRRGEVPAVNLVQIDVVHLEPPQRMLARLDDVFAAEAAAVRAVGHRHVDFGSDHDVVARGEFVEPSAGDLLAHPERVHVRGIEEGDAGFQGQHEVLAGFIHTERPLAPLPVAVAHTAQTDARHRQARLAQLCILHICSIEGDSECRRPLPSFMPGRLSRLTAPRAEGYTTGSTFPKAACGLRPPRHRV